MAPARVDPGPPPLSFPASSGGLKRVGNLDGYSKTAHDGGIAARGNAGARNSMGDGPDPLPPHPRTAAADPDDDDVYHPAAEYLSWTADMPHHPSAPSPRRFQLTPSRPPRPFQKWMRTLHKRTLRRQGLASCDGRVPPWLEMLEDTTTSTTNTPGADQPQPQQMPPSHYRYSSSSLSSSSLAFVTAVKSASISLAGASLLTRSRKTTTVRSPRGGGCGGGGSSRVSVAGTRMSEDGGGGGGGGGYGVEDGRQVVVDPAVVARAVQRRRILEELISTEEGYIGDVRFLMNVSLGWSGGCFGKGGLKKGGLLTRG